MKRRDFLYLSSGFLVSMLADQHSIFGAEAPASASGEDILKDVMIIDAHAHPDEFWSDRPPTDMSSSLWSIQKLGMRACVFSAVGDRERGLWEESFFGVMGQLGSAMQYVKSGRAKLIRKSSDIQNPIKPNDPFGCILAIEGANPLQRNIRYFDEVFQYGVRIITLGHYLTNDFTDIMTKPPKHNGLSALGKQAIRKMDDLGIVIDVAHASFGAIKDIVNTTRRPLVDSHTSVCHNDALPCGRYRIWREIELIAKTGGIVCTWPLARRREGYKRETFLDWAKEILEMKKRIGIEHVGLGTDGGGHLPSTIDGYDDVRDLRKLAAAMIEVGLSKNDIAAYMGGNFYRVFKSYTG
jgi:membrane dipeptidase